MADSMNYKDWYYKASRDIKAADIFFKAEEAEEDFDYSISSFHCQQCIEKYLKGYILKKTGKLLEGHNLTFLCRKATYIDSFLDKFKDGCKYVDKFYIEPRYPADILIINKKDARDCIDIACRISGYILEHENAVNTEMQVAVDDDEEEMER
jgi:HEPN domain-containing protein